MIPALELFQWPDKDTTMSNATMLKLLKKMTPAVNHAHIAKYVWPVLTTPPTAEVTKADPSVYQQYRYLESPFSMSRDELDNMPWTHILRRQTGKVHKYTAAHLKHKPKCHYVCKNGEEIEYSYGSLEYVTLEWCLNNANISSKDPARPFMIREDTLATFAQETNMSVTFLIRLINSIPHYRDSPIGLYIRERMGFE